MKVSLPTRLNLSGSHICTRFTQCEKVDPHIAVISALDKSTRAGRLQFWQAIGPKKLKSSGSFNRSIPAPQKLPCGMYRRNTEADSPICSKLTCESAKQLSKA